MFAGKKSAQIREILISESAWEEMTCLFAPSLMNKYSILGIPFAILILLACSDRNFVGKICNLSAFRFVGKFSFSIYLYHWLFLSLDTKVFGGNYLTFLSSITFSLILGIAAYYLIERPCNALRHYLEVNIRTRLSRSH